MRDSFVTIADGLKVGFLPGNIYLIKSEEFELYKRIAVINESIFVNFSFDGAIKVVPYFEQLPIKELNRVKLFLADKLKFKVDDTDVFGKLLIDIFSLQDQNKTLVIELTGLGNNSIFSLINLLKSYLLLNNQSFFILRQNKSPEFGNTAICVI